MFIKSIFHAGKKLQFGGRYYDVIKRLRTTDLELSSFLRLCLCGYILLYRNMYILSIPSTCANIGTYHQIHLNLRYVCVRIQQRRQDK